jgi:hypothetical protein
VKRNRPYGKVIIVILLVSLTMDGCELIRWKKDEQVKSPTRRPVARVNELYLFEDELAGIVDIKSTPEDSAARVIAYVNSWIRKQLIIQEATKRMNIDEAEVERKVLDYRYSLIGYEYQNYYIRQHLNDSITVQEVIDYYNDHLDNFTLKQNIVKGTFMKVPKTAPRTAKVREMIYSRKDKDIDELRSYCLSFSTAYHLGDSLWIEFDKLVVNSPIAEIPNKIQFLKTNPYYETSDTEFLYFLKVDDYKISDNVSPLEFVKEDIRNILLNKRKVELARALEDEVYENAVKQKNFEIFNR